MILRAKGQRRNALPLCFTLFFNVLNDKTEN